MRTKHIFLFIQLLFISLLLQAQTSDMGFSFQGYAIDPDGKALANENVTVKFSIAPGTFTEEHTLTTDAFGVFHAIVGNSSAAAKAEFEKIDFTKKGTIYSLKVEVKKTSGGSYTTISNEPMKAVPYARYAFNGVPVGTIVAYGGDKNNVPEGWLLCDGASVAQADYPQLYAIIGSAWGESGSSFNLPDLRGRFLRGVDGGAGNDPDADSRVEIASGGNTGDDVGTLQIGHIQSHNHGITDPGHNHSYNNYFWLESSAAAWPGAKSTGSSLQGYGGSSDYDNKYIYFEHHTGANLTGISVDNSGGSETRPVNAAVHYIIKY